MTSPEPATAPLLAPDPAVTWMNRGAALIHEGHRSSLEAALEAYNEAIALKRRSLSPSSPADAYATVSLAAALMNRGWLLHRLHGVGQATVALQAFDESAELLHPLVAPADDTSPTPSPWARRNLAGTLLNRGILLLDLGRYADARSAAIEALTLLLPYERSDLVDADLALKARRALCDAIGRLVVEPETDFDALAHEATDVVDDALALARYWTDRGAPFPREPALRIFHFGAQLYGIHQPHFLADFLREHLAPPHDRDPDLRAIALENIEAALAPRAGDPFYTAGDPATERRLQIAHDLEALRRTLRDS